MDSREVLKVANVPNGRRVRTDEDMRVDTAGLFFPVPVDGRRRM